MRDMCDKSGDAFDTSADGRFHHSISHEIETCSR